MRDDGAKTPHTDLASAVPNRASGLHGLTKSAAAARGRQHAPIVAVVLAVVLALSAGAAAVIFRGSMAPVADLAAREWASTRFSTGTRSIANPLSRPSARRRCREGSRSSSGKSGSRSDDSAVGASGAATPRRR